MATAEHFYQAIGEVHGTLVVAADGARLLDTGERQYPALIAHWLLEKFQDKQGFWRVYPVFKNHNLGFEVRNFREQPVLEEGHFTLQGDWTGDGHLKIWRNANATRIGAHNWRPMLLPVCWSDAPSAKGEFWQLKAHLDQDVLKVTEAVGPLPHPPRWEKRPAQAPQQHSHPPHQPAVVLPQTIPWEELRPVNGKLELTIKLNELPPMHKSNQQCHFKVCCDGRVFQVCVKPKQWAKLETATATYSAWVAAVSGKLGPATADGFVLEEASIQVYQTTASEALKQPSEPELDNKEDKWTKAAAPKAKGKTTPGASTASSTEEPKPRKMGRFNVQVR
ncbi:hypothetical protein AVDCRST_MAG81-2562 [uncultured Synechococcales cyanobacterium]|uniref:Uncharacterized protein n=1 Tax=uncultured Synechococcales cyanobacterium TaxID=1936017 RepID=A0A6J4VHC3_9CYAN|nr:hypothetical protein AVDCRST_MAG81-2562 [uncultured Synechococcales cyanobacterium]